MLLTLISASMTGDEMVITQKKPAKARRVSAITDEQMEREIQGEPMPYFQTKRGFATD